MSVYNNAKIHHILIDWIYQKLGIEKFLLQINPKTNRTDYLLLLFRFIQFNSSMINHASHVLSIVTKLSEYKFFSSQLLGLFLKSCTTISDQSELVHAFVQILEFDDLHEVSQNGCVLNSFKKVCCLFSELSTLNDQILSLIEKSILMQFEI